ncbi:MAG TPA: GDSL-type esterase/lipase family protein [Bryobacteraceae bacterium]|nr:GDSL-type esterase/lipase family protein [Bryobacteraceae bacterium]
MLPKKTSLAIVTFAALVLLLEAVKLARPMTLSGVIDFQPRPSADVEVLPPPRAVPPGSANVKHAAAEPNLIDKHSSLTAFYKALWRTESGLPSAVTRVLHYGDSPVTADSITADARSLFQQHYGDAGHGFILIAKPWAWYGHRGIEVQGKGWHIAPATQARARDGFHGLGGVSFEGDTGASSRIVLKEDHARVEIQFLRQPGGGVLSVETMGQGIASVDTDGPGKEPGFQTVPLPAGAREIDLTVQRGPVRLFGASFERDAPGVIYNSLGLNGGQVQVVVRYFEKKQWTEQLQHQHPDLVVLNYGTNESVYADYIERDYAGELREVIRRVKAAVPAASILVMSPMDRGQRDSTGHIVTVPTIPRLVEIQRQVAAEMDCAFFNTFQAMGGQGTMARWYEAQPRLVSADFMHPLPGGARKVGILLYEALNAAFQQFKASQQHQQMARRASTSRRKQP